MDATLRLARQHCQQLLSENDALSSNLDVLWNVIAGLQEIARLTGQDVGDMAFGPDLPPEVIQANIHGLGQRLQTLRDAQPKPETNGHARRVPVGAGKGEPDAT